MKASLRLSLSLSACTSAALIRRKSVQKFQNWLKSEKKRDTLREDICTVHNITKYVVAWPQRMTRNSFILLTARCRSTTIQKERTIGFSWQQLFRKQDIKLHYTYVAYLALSASLQQAFCINATFHIWIKLTHFHLHLSGSIYYTKVFYILLLIANTKAPIF